MAGSSLSIFRPQEQCRAWRGSDGLSEGGDLIKDDLWRGTGLANEAVEEAAVEEKEEKQAREDARKPGGRQLVRTRRTRKGGVVDALLLLLRSVAAKRCGATVMGPPAGNSTQRASRRAIGGSSA